MCVCGCVGVSVDAYDMYHFEEDMHIVIIVCQSCELN